jgi:hypothetical protein
MSAPEYIRGIREPLPDGERVLWQGAPRWQSIAVRTLHLRKVALYFGVLLAWRLASSLADGQSFGAALAGAGSLAIVAVLGLALIATLAWLSARTTIYAITTRRVMLRIGIALPIFVNLPFRGIEAVQMRSYRDGTADLPLELQDDVRLAYLHLWPHARPWRVRHPQPMLRGVRDGQRVAAVLREALGDAEPAAVPAVRVVPRAPRPAPAHGEAASTVAA